MPEVTESITVEATVEEASKLAADPGRLADWHPAIASSTVDGDARHLVLADGPEIDERITSRSESSYAYVIDDNPLPLDDYSSKVSVEPHGEGSTITWTGQFRPRGISDAEAHELVTGLYQAGLESLRERLA